MRMKSRFKVFVGLNAPSAQQKQPEGLDPEKLGIPLSSVKVTTSTCNRHLNTSGLDMLQDLC